MTIKKAKLTDPGLTVIFTERPKDRKEAKNTREDSTEVHPDLLQAFANLRIHLAILTGYVSVKQVKNIETPKDELIETFFVKGISIKTGDDYGLVISGHHTLENGKAVILNTPFTRFEEGEESAYKYIDDLADKVQRAETEIDAYLAGEKVGADPQGNLFEGQGNGQTKELAGANTGDPEIWEDGERPN
jgi:hypothetical protein